MNGELHNLEMEQALLGAILSDGSILDRIGFLHPEHFKEDVHARIFDASLSMAANGSAISVLSLTARLGQDAALAELGGASKYLSHLHAGCPIPLAAPDWARTIHDLAQRRALLATMESFQAAVQGEHSRPVAELIDGALETMSAIADDRPGQRTLHSIGEAAGALTDQLNRAYMDGTPAEDLISTGSTDLDRKLGGGWRRRREYVLAGRTSMGKTAGAVSFSLRAAMATHGVLYVSLEMDNQELARRCVADLAWQRDRPITYQDIERGTVEKWQLERVIEAEHRLRNLPFVIEDRSGLTMAAIRRVVRRVERLLASKGARLDLIVIDHLGLVQPSDEYRGNLVAQTGEVSRDLKALAKDCDCAVLALAQLNRKLEDRDSKRPMLADLRWSGDIEQDADVVMLVYRQEHYIERALDGEKDQAKRLELEAELDKCRHVLELIVAKQRGGPTGTVKLFGDMASNAVRDLGARP